MVDWSDGWLAKVGDQPITELPDDLYIPPDALRLFLEAFEGPMDLLLYLIRKHNIDILDIPVAEITRQYLEYIDLMQELRLELAAEYLVMAATLAEIKSRMLLPKPEAAEEEGLDDPRAELVRRLQEYERFKQAAEDLGRLQRMERDIYLAEADKPPMEFILPPAQVSFDEILNALKDVMQRAKLFTSHHVQMEGLSIRARMTELLERLSSDSFSRFETLFTVEEGRMGVVVTFIAILELIRNSVLELTQSEAFAPIYVKARNGAEEEREESDERTE
ncbi:MAG: segregation/condensation protein A [Coxiellaceae bacterium]|nr:segregation/condensation protein A [Coxiellaceae bacterium]